MKIWDKKKGLTETGFYNFEFYGCPLELSACLYYFKIMLRLHKKVFTPFD